MKHIKRNDIILFAVIILIVIIAYFVINIFFAKTPSKVIIEKNGTFYGEYDLSVNQTIDIDSDNVVLVENNTVRMYEANCPDKLCIHQGSLTSNISSIVCLPNEVVVYLETDIDSELDAVIK